MLNLAIISKDASVAGKPVKDTSPVTVYAVPTDSDLVRVSPTNKADWTSPAYVWKRYGDLKDGEQYEVTTSDIEPGDVKASKASAWGFIAKIIPVDPAQVGFDKLVRAAKSINARTSSTLLAADRKAIKEGLDAISGADVKIILTRPIEGISVPELGAPTSTSFNSMTVPLVRPSTGSVALTRYELERSLNGTTWTQIASGALIFGNPATAFVDGGLSASTLYYYRCRAVAGTRTTVYCATVSGTSAAVTGTATKWEGVGHGIGLAKTNSGGSDANLKATMDLIRTENNFKFVNFVTTWRVLEPTKGNYDWRYLDWMLAYLSNQGGVNSPTDGIVCPANQFAQPKYLWVEPWFMRFGVSSSGDFTFGTQPLPQWVIDAGYTYVAGGTAFGDLRIAEVRNAYKAMLIAMSQRYVNNPWFQGSILTESAGQQRKADYQEIALAVKQAVPRNNFSVGHNFIADPYPAGDVAFMNLMADNQVGVGGPDVKPRRRALSDNSYTAETFGQLAFRGAGVQNPYNAGFADFGSTDRRGQVPNFLQYQVKEDTSAEVYAWAEYMKCTHLAWWPEEGLSPDSYNWSGVNGIKATVNANPNRLWTTYPSRYL